MPDRPPSWSLSGLVTLTDWLKVVDVVDVVLLALKVLLEDL